MLKKLSKYKMKSKVVGQIHDSAEGVSPPKEMQDVLSISQEIVEKELPKHWPWLNAPLETEVEVADVDTSWFRKKQWSLKDSRWGSK